MSTPTKTDPVWHRLAAARVNCWEGEIKTLAMVRQGLTSQVEAINRRIELLDRMIAAERASVKDAK